MRPKSVDEYRERFRANLIGRWETAAKTEALSKEVFVFNEDGSGSVDTDTFGVIESEPIQWRAVGDLTIEIRSLAFDSPFTKVPYDFRMAEIGKGLGIVVFELRRSGFFTSRHPLRFLGE
ncbi:MAG: hypothetical protein KBF88_05560 [Polyangiaceae bacterium]|nr:hypothetical protein [Polyangiaceae bacterium]